MNRVVVIDTSILCVWLGITGKDSCGPDSDRWDRKRVEQKMEQEESGSSTFVLPLATIIETGNHISQAPDNRWEKAKALADLIKKCSDEKSRWAAFSEQGPLWEQEKMCNLADN